MIRIGNCTNDYQIRKQWVFNRATELRNSPTLSERIFNYWAKKYLKTNYEFQHPIEIHGKWYILDFFFPTMNVAIEIDGNIHKIQKDKDAKRDKDLLLKEIETIRIDNNVCTTTELTKMFKESIFSHLMRTESEIETEYKKQKSKKKKKKKKSKNKGYEKKI